METNLAFRRLGQTSGLQPWPWNPGDTVLSEGMKPVGKLDTEVPGAAVGIWSCNSGEVAIDGHPVNEVCFVTSGSVTLSEQNGRRETFKAGEAFLLPRGFVGRWSNTDDFAKVFVALNG